MTERLLQFIWQMQYYNKTDLHTFAHESLAVIHQGLLNSNQGPDFQNASIKINNTTWAGNIELHVKASDWKAHGHNSDKNYDNIILHVVWENDIDGAPADRQVPLLVLQDRVSKLLLKRYEELMYAQNIIPCEGSVSLVPELVWKSWKTRLATERLQRKTAKIETYLQQTNQHWEEVFWWMLAANFGITVNNKSFEAIARSVSVNILAKHKNQIHQLECLLLGQAGLLNADFEDDYPKMLQKEYRFYQKKYNFQPIYEPVHFLRMRPGNFPTIRLAQLAMLINRSSHLFAQVRATTSLTDIKKMFAVTANDYWHYRYRFDEPSLFKEKALGVQMINSIIINTVIPSVFAYGQVHNEQWHKNKAMQWLEEVSPEQNIIISKWKMLKISNQSALDSQALTELTKEYCLHRKCLHCAIGTAILKRSQ